MMKKLPLPTAMASERTFLTSGYGNGTLLTASTKIRAITMATESVGVSIQ